MIIWIIVLATITTLFGIGYLRGKCDGFIAGHNTSSLEKQKRYDIKRLGQKEVTRAQRRAARLEEIAEHGKPVSFRSAVYKSKKAYDRKRLKRMAMIEDK